MQNNEDDILLLTALKNGDSAAFEKVYLTWRKPVYYLLMKITRDKQDAEDITQDTFSTLWNTRDRIDPAGKIQTYIFLIARQSAIRLAYRQGLHDTYLSETEFIVTDTTDSLQIMAAKEMELLVKYAIEKMPERQREIYLMHSQDNLSTSEIAEKLNITRENVRSHLSNARKFLKEILTYILTVFLV